MSEGILPPEPTQFSISKAKYGEKYNEHLLQQYLLYVQMADKVSERRLLANTFFLTANTAIISALGVIVAVFPVERIAGGITALIALVTPGFLCYAWYRIVKSYAQLNTGKFAVIHKIERELPHALYEDEWNELGRGLDSSKYKPLTDVEKLVPLLFVVVYLVIGVLALLRALWA